MSPIVDDFPFPWHLREARELHIALVQMYPTGRAAVLVAKQAGLDEGQIFADQRGYMVWSDILELGAASKKNRILVERARDQSPTHPRAAFLDALLRAQPIVLDSEPLGQHGAPKFVAGNDDVTAEEALLFRDDLSLPFGRLPWLIGVLQKLKTLGASVCKMHVERHGQRQSGTGFRIAPDLLLTNWHVLHVMGEVATAAKAEFGFEDDGEGGSVASLAVPCDVTMIRSNEADDWSVIKLSVPVPDSIPILKLSEAAEPVLNEPAFIVQHPDGERKRIAYVRNQVTAFDERVVKYLTDTQMGSSGSPVLNGDGRLIALHHAGGRPQEVLGKPPLAKNEGIRIVAVMKGLASANVDVP